MNTLIELLPGPSSPVLDQPIRLTNATGSVVLDLTSERIWLVQDGAPQHELTLDKLHGILAVHFAEERII
jgi:hypothetical protein